MQPVAAAQRRRVAGHELLVSGHRRRHGGWVGATRTVPAAPRGEPGSAVLTGYMVIDALDLDAAAKLAAGCPGLAGGVDVEVAEVIPS